MPTTNLRTLAELREEIKKEARVKGSDNLDIYIRDTINEVLMDYAEKNRYFELLQLNVAIALTDAVGTYLLPDDFQTPKIVRYKRDNGGVYTLNPRTTYVENANGTLPRWYDLAANGINIFPFSQVKASDALTIDYYKYPDRLVADGDLFPIGRLLVPLKQKVIFRTHVYNRDLQTASVFSGSANEAETRSRKSDTDGQG